VRVLEKLGLADRLREFCTQPDFHKYSVWDSGETLLRTALMPRVRDTYGFAYYHAYRPDLINALTQGLDPQSLHLAKTVTAVGQDDAGAWAMCDDGSQYRGDLLIGADGIHSLVREQVFQPDPPRASGYVTWRGVVDSDQIKDLEIPISAYVDMGPRLSFVYYYVSGGRRLNWLALGKAEESTRESWSQAASKDELIAAFAGWYDRPRRIIEATEQPFVTALFDRHPLQTWISGRIAVMGDAAHAMLPYHAQGAVQSIEDAWVLARTLSLTSDAVDSDAVAALERFQALRFDRANLMVQQSRNAERWYHLDDPIEVASRNDRFRQNNERFGDDFSPQQHWLYSYDAERAATGTDDDWRALPAWS
jgi:salicylate hydroxylase